MPTSLPSDRLRKALEDLGLDEKEQQRSSLRTLIHRLTGDPPPRFSAANDLAEMLLEITYERGWTNIKRAMEQETLP